MGDPFASGFWESAERPAGAMAAQFQRLLADAPRAIHVGDRVVIAAGLIGRGHPWMRTEAVVLELGQSSVRVRLVGRLYDGREDETWIHPALVTDILGSPVASRSGGGDGAAP